MASLSSIHVDTAVAALKQGGILAYPTEAVWGLGCDPFNQQAVLKLLALKQRPMDKGLIIIAANVEQVDPYLQLLSSQERERVIETWQNSKQPTTWVVPVSPDFPQWVRGEHLSVAIRVSAHPPVQALCSAFGGAIISTSANITGQPTALTSEQIVTIFADGIDYILPASLGGQKNPSQIRDARTGAVLRPS
jgi:L-threonylcarbamoyladenylate synthase